MRRVVYNVVFDVLGQAEGYYNIGDILRDISERPFFLDGNAEARRHGYESFDDFITSNIMEDPTYADGHAGGLLKIDYRDGRPVFFRALPFVNNQDHYNNMVQSRRRKERRARSLDGGRSLSVGAGPHSRVDIRPSSVNRYRQSSAVVSRSGSEDDGDDETGFENYVPLQRPDDGQLRQDEASEAPLGGSDEWHAAPAPRIFPNLPDRIDMGPPPVPEIPPSMADADHWKWLHHWLIVAAWRVKPTALALSEIEEQIREEYPPIVVDLRGRFSNANGIDRLKDFIDKHLPMLRVFSSPLNPKLYHVLWNRKYAEDNPSWAEKYNSA
ncbi:hypothetical protein AAVH_36568 [Aphelenchoides avenae]|nr:hypothetical protein AAVH_36568 [Aphelenchus avenae]